MGKGMQMWEEMRLKPETAEETKDAETIQGKRRRLQRYARDNPMVRAVLDAAYYQGLSGEDTMTWLAYEALLRVEQLTEHVLESAMLSPHPRIITAPKDKL